LTREAGVTVVVAAGNTAGTVGDPGFGPDSLTVGAADTTTGSPTVAPFSGYGDVDGVTKPDVVAAGVNLLGEMPADSVIGQQYPNARQASGLFRGSGTSQSTAIVSGLAALYVQTHHRASPSEVKAAIRDAASSITRGSADGQGLVSIPRGGHVDSSDTGESSMDLVQWYSTGSIWGPFWLDAAWNTRMWDTRMWDTRMWETRMWDTRMWETRVWETRVWETRVWGTRVWDSQLWGDSS
jgi:serine protease AprX